MPGHCLHLGMKRLNIRKSAEQPWEIQDLLLPAMSTTVVCSTRPRVQLKVLHATARTYASPSDQSGDPKQQIIRRALYPSNVRSQSTPTGTWRPDVGRALQRAIPSK